MIKSTLILLIFFLSNFSFAEVADDHQLIRRLYLDVVGRLPTVDEFVQADKKLRENNGYTKLTDSLLSSSEFKENLSWQIVRHYGPGITMENTIGLERARQHIEKKYLGPNKDFKVLINDILTAKGIEAYNPLVRFYTTEDTPNTLTNRFSERVLGVPIGCAQCHDHKFYPKLLQKDYWGLTGFFQEAKIKYVQTDVELKEIRKDAMKAGSTSLGDKVYFNTWMYQESQKKSLLKDRKIAYIGPIPYADNYYMMQDEDGMEEDNAKELIDPQLVIYEPKVTASSIKVKEKLDGYKYNMYKASLPLKGKFSRSRDYPRTSAALWMTGSNLEYFDKETVNWIVNWFMGKGIKMPITDVYFSTPEEEKEFSIYTSILKDSKYDIQKFIRTILLSKKYKTRNKMYDTDTAKNPLRQLRYLTGRQMAESFFDKEDKLASQGIEDSSKFSARTRVEFMKVKFQFENFPDSLEPQLHGPGTVMQSQLTSSASTWINYIDKIANEGYKSSKTSERWLTETYVRLFTRYPTVSEIEYLTPLLNRKTSFDNSNFQEVIWALINSPEMRIY
ncbi:MAG: DUF1549 domain-containing protein [Lentisphaeraceae bacterium]|nr:DUF1549 domain-containing protein [Lentisphaeraceae bacterium]